MGQGASRHRSFSFPSGAYPEVTRSFERAFEQIDRYILRARYEVSLQFEPLQFELPVFGEFTIPECKRATPCTGRDAEGAPFLLGFLGITRRGARLTKVDDRGESIVLLELFG